MGRKKKSQKVSVIIEEPVETIEEVSFSQDEEHTSQSGDTSAGHSPKAERSSTPIIHKKFGKVICPNDPENSPLGDLLVEADSQSQDELQMSVKEEEVQAGDVLMTEDSSHQLYEIDERLKQVAVSNDSNAPSSHLISSSSSNSNASTDTSSPISIEASNVQSLDKLLPHRSRSGSTDTTSSEGTSTSSSSVRRSSRIKHTVQHRHREVVDSTPSSQNANGSSDKSKPLLLAPPSPSSDVDKPVKVKSRWRRTSELEQVVRPHTLVDDASHHSSPSSNCDINEMGLGLPCPAVEEKLKTFERIDFNIYKTVRYTNKRAKEKMICDCFLTKEEMGRGEMGCGEDCLNRLLMIECCSRCNLKDRCSNKRFQNLEYAKCEMFKTEMKGFGLRALEDIPADTFLFEYVGEVVDTTEFHRRALEYSQDNNRHFYFMSLRPDAIIDATIKGNISRFINHSCDPNSETQKWTVDGELRIGFFSRKNIKRGEELTFDYQYQRYGNEAQKCYCGAKNCRGWIGENPDDEISDEEEYEEEEEEETVEESAENVRSKLTDKDKEEGEGKKKAEKVHKGEAKKRGRPKKKRDPDYVVDDPEKDLITLSQRGIHNKMDTLAVLRCLVLAENATTRYEVLRLIRTAAAPCRRLLIDYHILKLLYSWMSLKEDMSEEETIKHRMEILETLSILPIPDKTKLKDSNVLQAVTEWSQSQETDSEELKAVSKEASKLLDQWANLKDTFRIPKKERIEQMKEHEREADRGYREKDSSYARTWDRYRGDVRKDDRYKSDPDRYKLDHRRDRKSSRDSPPRSSRLTKYEHRQLFALKVQAKDEERRKQEMEWNIHVERCKGLGLDPTNVSGFDEMTGYPVFINPPPMGTMIPWYPPTPDMSVAGTPQHGTQPIGFGPNGTPIFPPPSMFPLPMGMPLHPPMPPMGYMGTPGGYPLETPPQQPPPPPPNLPPPIRLPKFWKTAADSEGRIYYYHMKTRQPQWEPPPYQPPLPPPPDESSSSSSGESSESSEEEDEEDYDEDKFLRSLNKKIKSEHSTQLLMGPTENGTPSVDTGENQEQDGTKVSGALIGCEDFDHAPSSTVQTPPSRKRKREGLCTEYIISPIQEVDKQKAREAKRKIKETKEKLKVLKKKKYMESQAAMKDLKAKKKLTRDVCATDLGVKHKITLKTEVSSSTIESAAADSASEPSTASAERQMKEQFRLGMAGVIVHYLNPFRKEDCTRGRITCHEDFKHLARKLTHFVLVKELRHCRSVGDLQCNDNVKHKAKDFIRKYMSKFGAVYIREKETE